MVDPVCRIHGVPLQQQIDSIFVQILVDDL
jgi:hypothetical protein